MRPNRPTNRIISTNRNWTMLASLLLTLGMGLAACEGTTGPEGPEGPQGSVGPAGEDGSQIFAGDGAPDDGVGSEGDYYLNQQTGELYGPKASSGWPGSPGVVLYGEDGADGQDGADGSQIHSGTGAPDASLGSEGDFYLDEESYDLYGPKTSGGWGTALNLQGPAGNANVTRHIFPGSDFSGTLTFRYVPTIESEAEMRENAWLVYLVTSNNQYYQIPGMGALGESEYRTWYNYSTPNEAVAIGIILDSGPGEEYAAIEVFQIGSSNTIDHNKQGHGPIIPEDLDVSDYEAVAEYYGFGTQ